MDQAPLELAERRLPDLGDAIDQHLPEGCCYAVLFFTTGAGGFMSAVTNADRPGLITARREYATHLMENALRWGTHMRGATPEDWAGARLPRRLCMVLLPAGMSARRRCS